MYSRNNSNLAVHYHQQCDNVLSVQAVYDFLWDNAVVGHFPSLIVALRVGLVDLVVSLCGSASVDFGKRSLDGSFVSATSNLSVNFTSRCLATDLSSRFYTR